MKQELTKKTCKTCIHAKRVTGMLCWKDEIRCTVYGHQTLETSKKAEHCSHYSEKRHCVL